MRIEPTRLPEAPNRGHSAAPETSPPDMTPTRPRPGRTSASQESADNVTQRLDFPHNEDIAAQSRVFARAALQYVPAKSGSNSGTLILRVDKRERESSPARGAGDDFDLHRVKRKSTHASSDASHSPHRMPADVPRGGSPASVNGLEYFEAAPLLDDQLTFVDGVHISQEDRVMAKYVLDMLAS